MIKFHVLLSMLVASTVSTPIQPRTTPTYPPWSNMITTRIGGSNGMVFSLGAACPFVLTAQTGITLTAGPSQIYGDVGVAPIAIGAITGLTSMQAGAGPSSADQLKGNSGYPGLAAAARAWSPTSISSSTLPNTPRAILASTNLFFALNSLPVTLPTSTQVYTNYLAGQLVDGTILKPGVYHWTGAVVLPVGATVTLNGKCGDLFVFIVTGALATGASSVIQLGSIADGANQLTASSVFWTTSTTFVAGVSSKFSGIIVTGTNVVLGVGSSVVGLIHSRTEIAIQSATITRPGSCVNPNTGFTFALECDSTVLNGLQAPLTPIILPLTCTPTGTCLLARGTCATPSQLQTAYAASQAAYIASQAALQTYNTALTAYNALCVT